eukprot:CFRG0512T1
MARNLKKSVFVGNIPYDATEEQLTEKFREAGPVVHFRLVFDRDTGKPKGYGFCEYMDEESAQCALRNLTNTEMLGRMLRVDYADKDARDNAAAQALLSGTAPPGAGGPSDMGGNASGWDRGMQDSQQRHMQVPVQGSVDRGNMRGQSSPQHQQIQSSLTQPVSQQQGYAPTDPIAISYGPSVPPAQCAIAIESSIKGMSVDNLSEALRDMSAYIKAYPNQARYLLLQNPQLAYALVEAQKVTLQVTEEEANAYLLKSQSTTSTAHGNHNNKHKNHLRGPQGNASVNRQPQHQPQHQPQQIPQNLPPHAPPQALNPQLQSSNRQQQRMPPHQMPHAQQMHSHTHPNVPQHAVHPHTPPMQQTLPPPSQQGIYQGQQTGGRPVPNPNLPPLHLHQQPPPHAGQQVVGSRGPIRHPQQQPPPQMQGRGGQPLPPQHPGYNQYPQQPQQQQQHQHHQQQQQPKSATDDLSSDERRQYFAMVLNLKQEDINQLPPDQRESMMLLREQALASGMF